LIVSGSAAFGTTVIIIIIDVKKVPEKKIEKTFKNVE